MAMGVIAQTVARAYTDAPITLTVDNITDGSIRVNTRGLQKANFRRKFEIFYKRSTASTYKRWAYHYYEAGEVPSDPIRYNVGRSDEQRLIPGKEYNFKVSITDVELSKTYVTKYITASTAAATCTPTITATSSQITVQIPDLKPVAYYGRIVEVESMLVDIEDDYGIATRKFIRAGNTAPAPLTLTWKTNFFGENCKIRVNLWTGDAVDSYETKYKTITKSIFIPWDGVSVPKINSVAYTAPGASISVNWGLSLHYVDNLEETDFTFYIEREDGSIVRADTVRRTSAAAMTTDIDVSSWLLDDETVEVYIVASGANIQGTAQSNRYEIKLGRLFHWDTEKVQGGNFNITASEWNRLVNYIDDAAELYPDYFTPTTDHPVVETDDQVTAVIANKVPICTTRTGSSSITNRSAWTGLYNNGTIVRTNHRVDSATATFAVTYDAGARMTSRTLQTVIDGNNVRIPAGQENADISSLENVTKCVLTVTYEYGSLHQFDTISAALFTDLVNNVNTAMHEATGL